MPHPRTARRSSRAITHPRAAPDYPAILSTPRNTLATATAAAWRKQQLKAMQKMRREPRRDPARGGVGHRQGADTTIGEIPMVNFELHDVIHNVEKRMGPGEDAGGAAAVLVARRRCCSGRPSTAVQLPVHARAGSRIGVVAAGCPFVLKPSDEARRRASCCSASSASTRPGGMRRPRRQGLRASSSSCSGCIPSRA